ncbi:MAG TPA: hypothetical protein VJR03_12925 [Nitrospira sp.]|nr:hypothetical protein [Nitrospira sp.]
MTHIEASARLSVVLGLLLLAILSACGSPEHDNSVPVNLSLVVDPDQAAQQSQSASPVLAFIDRWLVGGVAAWAQAVTDIHTIQVQISGPDISSPPSMTVAVTNPTSGQVIPVSIQAPAGTNRTISVAAFNAANPPVKIYSGSAPNVSLTPGTPVNVTVTLARTVTITVTKQGAGTGAVTSTPDGINCIPGCITQSARFDAGATVTLNAAPASGSSFAGWSGGGCSGTGACTVTLPSNPPNNSTVALTATFNGTANTLHLSINKSGTGTGTVTSIPVGISCGQSCAADFQNGTTVTLTAVADTGSTFTGWSGGGCSGTGTCIVVITNSDQTVTASFATPNTFTLTVTKAGVGVGTVTSSPAGINCGTTCAFTYPNGTSVTLTATVAAGSTFGGWSGGGCSGTAPCTIVMNQNRTVTATFNAVPATLTVNKAGTGAAAGSVTSSPAGINCGNTCSASFPTGSIVTLTATAPAGTVFAGWSGGGCSGTGTCTTVMASNQTVVATFNTVPMFTLTVTKSGTGNGTVTSSPAGINCGSDCSQSYGQGTVVTLTAAPNGNSTFAGWSGGGCSGTGACTVTMNATTTVGAQFTKTG